MFESLNINATIEISPNVIMAETKQRILKKKHQNDQRDKAKYTNPLYQNSQRQEFPFDLKLNSKPDQNEDIRQQRELEQWKTSDVSQGYFNSFSNHFYQKVNENSIKISSLKLKPKRKRQNEYDKFSSKHSNHSLKLNEVNTMLRSQHFSGYLLETFVNSFRTVNKNLSEYKIYSKKKKPVYSDRYKLILKSLQSQFFQNSLDKNSRSSKISFEVIWKVKDHNFYIPTSIIAQKVLSLRTKYDHAFKVKGQIQLFFEFLLASQRLELYQRDQLLFDESCQDTCKINIDDELEKQPDEIQKLSLEDGYKSLLQLYKTNQQWQKVLHSLVEQSFLVYFVRQETEQGIGFKNREVTHFQQESFFNNYEFHAEPSNLAAFVPSYQERSHFLLDKFGPHSNIFEDEEKLLLLLKLSRDPYLPRSSAKYISHISALVEDIFGLKGKDQQKQEENENLKKLKAQREKEDQEVQAELKEWENMFGELVLRI